MRCEFIPATTPIRFQNCSGQMAWVGLLICMAVGLSGCGGSGKASRDSDDNLKDLSMAVHDFHEANRKWPDNLEEVKPLIGKEIGHGKDYATLLINPLTGDNPGYEYVKPEPNAPSATTIVLYQLRGGKRDESLHVGFADSGVGPAKSTP